MRDLLTAGLTALDLDPAAAPQLERYAELLLEKNKVMNLTAITAPRDVATLHLLDCAALAAQLDLSGKRVIDVGTGAGFPGMVLAILTPDARFTLLDSLGKRVDFLKEVQTDLGLKNVTCVHARAEEFAAQHREQFDLAASRAVAQLNVLCELTLPLVKVGGQFAAMKSVSTDEEIRQAHSALRRHGLHRAGDGRGAPHRIHRKNTAHTEAISPGLCPDQKSAAGISGPRKEEVHGQDHRRGVR